MKTPIGMILAGSLLAFSCSQLRNDLPAPVAPGISVHDAAWTDSLHASVDPGFHGQVLKTMSPAWNDQNCRNCHGGTYTGGTAGVACFSCHPPYPHAVAFPSSGRHRGYLKANDFPLQQCQKCHGSAATGGAYLGGNVLQISCEQSGCHVDAAGNPKSPESCNTCHGVFSTAANLQTVNPAAYLLSAAPPNDVAGDTATSAPGVGAHQKHLATGTTGRSVKCQECHVVPQSVFDPGHLPSVAAVQKHGVLPVLNVRATTVATVVFNDTLANLATGGGAYVPHPSFDPATAKCSGTYCHGSWLLTKGSASTVQQEVFADTATVMVGASASPAWTDGAASGTCWSCHGTGPSVPTPMGHQVYEVTACYICHGDVTDANGNILNRSKHMNGVIDLVSGFGGSRPMR
ncbi:MAG TPA: hypothetical protein VL221_15475 [Bacteroidota bacterium]|nr:hypothetical protein [Bacteroidota bacterium]